MPTVAPRRNPPTQTLTIANGAATSDTLDLTNIVHGSFAIPASFTGASVTFTGCATVDGTFQAVHVAATNAAVSITVTSSKTYPLPAEVLACNYAKIVSASNETGAKSIICSLKQQ